MLQGYSLVFPEGRGIDFVEPAFATLIPNPSGSVHGVSTLFSVADAAELDKQEGGGSYYTSVTSLARVYDDDDRDGTAGEMMAVEIYTSKKPQPLGSPQGPTSERYRDILVMGARESNLDPAWIDMLVNLPTYTPSGETLAKRRAVPHPHDLPAWSIAELKRHDGGQNDAGAAAAAAAPTASAHAGAEKGSGDELSIHFSSCGFIFKHKPIFPVYRGRDVTFRNCLQRRGINLDVNDDGGVSPFPQLVDLEPHVLEYCLQYRDRFIAKAGNPVAVLEEFWAEQKGLEDGRLATLGMFAEKRAVKL